LYSNYITIKTVKQANITLVFQGLFRDLKNNTKPLNSFYLLICLNFILYPHFIKGG